MFFPRIETKEQLPIWEASKPCLSLAGAKRVATVKLREYSGPNAFAAVFMPDEDGELVRIASRIRGVWVLSQRGFAMFGKD